MKPSSEALLVSALINSANVLQIEAYGLSPEMFIGYQPEFRWVVSYQQTYGNAPSKEALKSKFPDFPLTEHEDAVWAADEIRYSYSQRALRAAVRKAATCISEGDYEEAAMAVSSFRPLNAVTPVVDSLKLTSFLDRYEDRPDALDVPWKTLQNITGGIRSGDLWYLAARLGQGKSWSLGSLTAKALMDGRKVSFYSLEMSEAQVLTRMHVILGKALGMDVDHIAMRDRIYDVIAYRKLVNKIRDEVPGELYIHDSSRGKVSPATVAVTGGESDLVVIDYASLMATPMGKRAVDDWRVMASISNELKEVAVTQNIRIVAAAQINRDGDSVSKYPPKVKNLAQSDALGQDGDVVLTHKQFCKSANIYSIEKNRHGASGIYFYTRFLPNEGTFNEISKEMAEDLRDNEHDD